MRAASIHRDTFTRLLAASLLTMLAACGGSSGGGADAANAVPQSASGSCVPSVSSGFAAVTASNGLVYSDGTADASASGGEGVGIGASLGSISGGTVTIARSDGTVVGTASTDAFGMVTVKNCGSTLPVLVKVSGGDSATYWDEALQQSVAFPSDRSLHLMLAPVSGGQTLVRNAGVTPLTEAAYQYTLAQLGGADAWKNAANIVAAHQAVGSALNAYLPASLQITDPTRLPAAARDASSPVFDGTSASSTARPTKALTSTSSPNVRYGLVMAALARQSATYNPGSSAPALELLRQLVLDLYDGTIDGVGPGNAAVAPGQGSRAYAPASMQADLLLGVQRMAASNSTTQSLSTFNLLGTVSGLTGSGLVLANGPSTISVASGASSFDFGTVLVEGSSYSISVRAHPAQQTCTVVQGGGTAGAANVTSPTVSCQNIAVPRSLSGSITGLTAGGLVLATGSSTVAVSNGATSFSFGANFSEGMSYNVSVHTQPSGLTCTVSNGSGTVPAADVSNIAIACAASGNRFAWMGGANTANQVGVYGTLGQADNANGPGARSLNAQASDSSGNFWLFGGYGEASASGGFLNDLWRFNPTDNTWTWIAGSDSPNALGVYGTKGIAAPGQGPGARYGAVAWATADGIFWLYGGYGYAASGYGPLSDLWRFDPGNGLWTWMSGSSTINSAGVYGTLGVSSPTNHPGSRDSMAGWLQASDDSLWLFGGFDGSNWRSDVWRYKDGDWTWMQGGSAGNDFGTYGTRGTSDVANAPGARGSARVATDSAGNVWLFGGYGFAASGPDGRLSDLWRRNPTTGQWTWVSGSNTSNAAAVYGTRGVSDPSNEPGARYGPLGLWVDIGGNVWIMGGAQAGMPANREGDLWRYSALDDRWTWMHGANTVSAAPIYGTLGQPDDTAFPGARSEGAAWADSAGRFWMFGGFSASGQRHSDLWRYQP